MKRKGNVIARMIDNTDTRTLDISCMRPVGLLCTDEHSGNRNLDRTFPHEVIRKSESKYVFGGSHEHH